MSELSICDHFCWTLDDIRELTLKDYNGVIVYLKKVEAERKKADRKSKMKGRKR